MADRESYDDDMRIPDEIIERAEKAEIFGVPTAAGNEVAGTVGGLMAWLPKDRDTEDELE